MLKFLTARESGIDSPVVLRRIESTKRAYSLELSKHRDVESVFYGGINSLDIDPVESKYLLSGTVSGTLHIHDLTNHSGEVKHTTKAVCNVSRSNPYKHKHSVETVQWYPLDTGMFLSSGTDRTLKIWDTNSMKPADEYEFSGIVYSHHMSPVATTHCLVAVGCHSSTLKLVDLKSGSATHMLKGHKKSILTVRWSPKNEYLLVSGSEDNRVLLWDVRSSKGSLMSLDQFNGQEVPTFLSACTAHSGNVNGMSFTMDGLHLVTSGTDNRIRLWNIETGRNTLVNYGKIQNETRKGLQFAVSCWCKSDLIYIPDEYCNIQVYEMFTGRKIDTLRGHLQQVNCCVFHPDYQELYSGGNDRNVLIWEPELDGSYDNYLKERSSKKQTQSRSFVSRIAATADSWSSDEET